MGQKDPTDKSTIAESNVLIVDDDAVLRHAVSRTLEHAGHRVSEAATGQEGLHLISEQKPDLVLLDVVLPDLDGIEVCRRIKADPSLERVFVVLLSGMKTGSAEQVEGLEAEADGYVARPISNRELLVRVEAMLRIKRAEDALRQAQDELERRVAERTADLRETNARLKREIAERQRAEQSLRESEEQLRLAILGSGGALWDERLDPEASFDDQPGEVYLSPSGKKLLGYQDDELEHSWEAWDGHVLPEDQPLREKRQREHFEGRTDYLDHEYRVRRKDGSIRWIHGCSRIIRDERGRPIRWIGIDWDVTERKEAEEALREYREHLEILVEARTAELRESEATARALLNAPTDTAALIDRDGVILDANGTMARLYGWPREELIGQCVWDLFPPEVAARRKLRIAEVFDTGRPIRFEDERQGIWFDNVVYPVQDAQGRMSKVAVMARDVTERVQAEQKATHLNAVLRAIRNVNQLIVQEKDRGRMLEGACRNLVETRGFHSAWIALLDESGALTAAAQAGLEAEFEALNGQLARDEWPSCAKRAVSQKEVVVVDAPLDDCADCPLVPTYAGQASMAVRLEHDGVVYGLLAVSVPREYALGEEEHSLLREVAGDLAYALHGLEREEERQRMETAVRESHEKYHALYNSIRDAILVADTERNIIDCNPAFTELFGYTLDDIKGRKTLFVYENEEQFRQLGAALKENVGNPKFLFTVNYRKKSGEVFAGETNVFYLEDREGNVEGFIGLIRDVTEQIQAEKEIANLARFPSENPNPVLRISRDGTVLYANEAGLPLLRVWGCGESQPLPEDWREFVKDVFRLAVKREAVVEVEGRVFSLTFAPVADEDYVNVYGLDITGRMQAEEKVGRLAKFPSENPNPVLRISRDGTILYTNEAGLPLMRAWGCGEGQLLPGDWRELTMDAFRSGVKREAVAEVEERIFSLTFAPVTDADYVNVYGLDVTGRMQAEEERVRLVAQIQEQARQMRMVLNTVPEGVLLLDPQYRVIMTNRAAEKEISLLVDVSMGDRLIRLGDRTLEDLLTSPPKGLWHEVAAGSRSFEVIARPIENGRDPLGWVLVLRDVTTEREVQQSMHRQERLAAVGQLAAGIAHDFNNIMSVIVLYAQLALRSPGLSEGVGRRLETIADQADHATDLIQQILDFGRRSVLERRPMDLVPFLKELVKLLERTLPESIVIDLTYGTDSYKVNADPTRMQQAIMNLAVNARDAMPEGGELNISLDRLRVAREKSAPQPGMAAGDWVRVTVTDTGTGIPPEVLPHIFEPFFTTKTPGKGSGLGLAQVYGIVKQHEGELDVTSKEGEGATFVLYLPFMETARSRSTVAMVGEPIRGQGQCILVVEDSAETRKALVESLTILDYVILTAGNGREALEILEQRGDEIDLVLSDVVMPEMGGVPLLHALREREWALPVVMLTGHSLKDQLEGLRAQGMTDWLPKPPSLERLAQVVARALGSE